MIRKSKKGAFVMASIAFLSAAVVFIAVRCLLAGDTVTDVHTVSGTNNAIMDIAVWMGTVLIIILFLIMASLWIYGLDDYHFGPQGAVRWVAFGAICALLVQVPSLILPSFDSIDSANSHIFQVGWSALMIGLSYLFVFRSRLLFAKRDQKFVSLAPNQPATNLPKTQRLTCLFEQLMTQQAQGSMARRQLQAMSWFLIIGGMIMLLIVFLERAHPNPYVRPTLILGGLECMILGSPMLLALRKPRLALWLMFLGSILPFALIYFFIRSFTYTL
jgi:hypothetical protein